MGSPAATMGDAAGHGGTIVLGSVTVLIGGKPAARMGDPIVCPGFDGPKPHVMGNITVASSTVMIDGAFAARMGDMTGCGVAGVSGKGAPPVAGPPAAPGPPGSFSEKGAVVGDNNVGFLVGEYSGYENADGGQHQVKGSLERLGGTYTAPDGSTASGSIDGVTATGEVHYGDNAIGASATGNVVAAQGKVSTADGNSAGASGGLLNAGAGFDLLAGSDGRRTGIALGGSAQASVAEGQVDSVKVIPIPFTDYTINAGSTVGGSVGSVGGAANAGAYHDAADDRVHLAGMIDIEVVIGAKLGMDISFGRAAGAGGAGGGTPGIPVPLTPGSVMMGAPTVLIG